jgi:hypothetical protein
MSICSMATRSRWLLILLCLLSVGCGGGEGRTLSLNKDAARDACTEFLEAWKKGGKSADLQPAIIGKDSDWEAGQTLTGYELLPNEMDGGSNLHIPVRLTLKNAQGREEQQDVTYIVGTSPKVTVFRE